MTAGDEDVFGAPAPRLVLVLQPRPGHPKRCSQCGAIVEKIHDVSGRRRRSLEGGYGVRRDQVLPGHSDVSTAMVYTRVSARGTGRVRGPLEKVRVARVAW